MFRIQTTHSLALLLVSKHAWTRKHSNHTTGTQMCAHTHLHARISSFDRADGGAVYFLAAHREHIGARCRRVGHHSLTFACKHTHALRLQGQRRCHRHSYSGSDLIIFMYVFSGGENEREAQIQLSFYNHSLMSSWISRCLCYQRTCFLVQMPGECVFLLSARAVDIKGIS